MRDTFVGSRRVVEESVLFTYIISFKRFSAQCTRFAESAGLISCAEARGTVIRDGAPPAASSAAEARFPQLLCCHNWDLALPIAQYPYAIFLQPRDRSAYQTSLYYPIMGNCCGKPSDKNFSGEGHTVGARPAQPQPTGALKSTSQGGRTLGNSAQGNSGSSPREAAAKAAEVRTYNYTTEPRKSQPRTREPKKMVATAWI